MRGHVGFCRTAFGLYFIALTAGMAPCVSAMNYFESMKSSNISFFPRKSFKNRTAAWRQCNCPRFRQIPRIRIMLNLYECE